MFNKTFEGQTRKVGVIGYVTPDTQKITTGGRDSAFTREEVALANEAKQLREQGVDIIIAIGHSGYQRDLEIAEKVLTAPIFGTTYLDDNLVIICCHR